MSKLRQSLLAKRAARPVDFSSEYYTKEQVDTLLDTVGGGAAWGTVTGTLSDQTDLQAELDAKLDATDIANMLETADIGVTVQAYDADTLKADVSDNLTAGFTSTAYNAGTKSSGTFTPDPANGNIQRAVNGGAHTLAPPSVGSGDALTMVIQYTNNGSAGAVTTSGFTKVDGSFTTTNGDDFMCYISVVNGFSHLNIVALQ